MDVLRELFASKKFVVGLTSSLAAILVQLASKHGAGWLDAELADRLSEIVVLVACTYVGAQGAADLGKHAAEVEAQASPKAEKEQL